MEPEKHPADSQIHSQKKRQMINRDRSLSNVHYDKPQTSTTIAKVQNILGRSIKQTSFFAVMGLIVLGVVAVFGLQVIDSADCGGSLSFKSSSSSQEFQLKKEACKSPDTGVK